MSTKTSLSEEDIIALCSMGYEKFQFSLDSASPTILTQLVNTPTNYIDKVAEMLRLCSEHGLKITIRSVVTSINGNISQIKGLYDFLSKYDCIEQWAITPAFFSEYKQDKYHDYEISNESLKNIYAFTQQDGLNFKILLNKIGSDGYKLKRCKTVEDFVCKNQICMANTTVISILANGICSVCEMLYDHTEYQLGNVNESSIREIWNSDKALNLYSPRQEYISKESLCSTCSVYAQCKTDFGKRVCYIDIMKTGGSKDDPDPRCPLAKKCEVIL